MKKPSEEKLILKGPAGDIQTLYSVVQDAGEHIAVICHPHPLYGGTMDNKVVHYTARALHEMGMPVARFNFRGVGQSAGTFADAVGEADDVRAVIDWLRRRHPDRPLLLAGFSFGSYVAASIARQVHVDMLISIAPPVNLYNFGHVAYSNPWLIIMGDEDEVVPVDEVRQWLSAPWQGRQVVWMEGASHFFHGRLPELSGHIQQWVTRMKSLP